MEFFNSAVDTLHIRKVLAVAKQKAAQQPKRAKEKIKQRGLER